MPARFLCIVFCRVLAGGWQVRNGDTEGFGNWSPDTMLSNLNWMSDDDEAEYWYPEAKDCTQAWLYDVFADAKMSEADLSGFSGTTLGDAISVLLTAHKTG